MSAHPRLRSISDRAATAALLEILEVLSTCAGEVECLWAVAHAVAPRLADTCTLWLFTGGGPPRRVAVVAAFPEDEAGLIGAGPDPAVLDARSVVVVPLVGRDRELGVLAAGMTRSGRRRSRSLRAMLASIGRAAGHAVEHARLRATSQRRAQEKAVEAARVYEQERRARERLDLIVAASRLGTWDWSLATGALEWDERTREIHGAPPDFQPDLGAFLASVHREDLSRVQEAIQAALRLGGNGQYFLEFRIHRLTGGDLRWVEVHGRVLFQDARATRFLGTVKDVTSQKLAARQLEAALARTTEADRRKEEFLAMLGHELRNPLAPILTALELMRVKGGGLERERAVIERQVRHVERLVDDLLDVSRITRGKLVLRKRRLDFSEVVREAIETASPLLEQQRHRLHVELPPGVLPVIGDPARLRQVVENLVANAAKYTEPAGDVWLSAESRAGDVVFSITDTGIGMDAQLLSVLFEPFTQAPQAMDRAQGGLGLGLMLVRSLVTLHDGTVEAWSAGPGRGSTFTVRLPCAPACSMDEPSEPAPRTAPFGSVQPLRVLVVDDNLDAAAMLAEVLTARGHDVRVAADGPSAIVLAREHVPQVALLDIGLPVMDGYELGRLLLERQPAPAVIAISGYGRQQDLVRSKEAGFRAHFVKPVDLAKLMARMDDIGEEERRRAA
jgi:PAS domain S-box-containing protein